ncbi:MAG: ATP-grasp domain-containing protein [Sediminibacterium sp.]
MVTGCGGDIGQSIGKILCGNPLFKKVIGADLNTDHPGKFIFEKSLVLPRCTDPTYLDSLQSIIEKENINLILPMAEAELRLFNNSLTDNYLSGKPLVMANRKAMDTGFDKLATAEFLKQQSLPYPITTLVRDTAASVFPLIVKKRTGAGSKDLFIVNDAEELSFYQKKYPEFIAQELVGNAEAEYTCGLFRSAKGETRQIIFRRKLTGGFSGFGVYEENEQIRQLLDKIATLLELRGSINVQLRLSEKGPCVFEINPRFSSTVLFRHMMGFEDVIWSIQDLLGLPLSAYQRKTQFTKFYKGFNEYVD